MQVSYLLSYLTITILCLNLRYTFVFLHYVSSCQWLPPTPVTLNMPTADEFWWFISTRDLLYFRAPAVSAVVMSPSEPPPLCGSSKARRHDVQRTEGRPDRKRRRKCVCARVCRDSIDWKHISVVGGRCRQPERHVSIETELVMFG